MINVGRKNRAIMPITYTVGGGGITSSLLVGQDIATWLNRLDQVVYEASGGDNLKRPVKVTSGMYENLQRLTQVYAYLELIAHALDGEIDTEWGMELLELAESVVGIVGDNDKSLSARSDAVLDRFAQVYSHLAGGFPADYNMRSRIYSLVGIESGDVTDTSQAARAMSTLKEKCAPPANRDELRDGLDRVADRLFEYNGRSMERDEDDGDYFERVYHYLERVLPVVNGGMNVGYARMLRNRVVENGEAISVRSLYLPDGRFLHDPQLQKVTREDGVVVWRAGVPLENGKGMWHDIEGLSAGDSFREAVRLHKDWVKKEQQVVIDRLNALQNDNHQLTSVAIAARLAHQKPYTYTIPGQDGNYYIVERWGGHDDTHALYINGEVQVFEREHHSAARLATVLLAEVQHDPPMIDPLELFANVYGEIEEGQNKIVYEGVTAEANPNKPLVKVTGIKKGMRFLKYDPKTNTVTVYTEKDGLPNRQSDRDSMPLVVLRKGDGEKTAAVPVPRDPLTVKRLMLYYALYLADLRKL